MIPLTDDLVMIADDYCYTIGKPRQRADKGVILDHPTYYTTAGQAVQGALNRTMRKAVKDGRVTTLKQFVQEQERQRTELERLIFAVDSGQPRQNVVEAREAIETGKDIPQHGKEE